MTDNRGDKYNQLSDIDHVKNRPDMFLGSDENIKSNELVYENNKLIHKDLRITPAAYKCVDEILVNACDQIEENKKSKIFITFDETGQITVKNTPTCIPIVKKKLLDSDKEVFLPEFLFGYFKTSGNYGDIVKSKDAKGTTGGKNGYGAKLTNAFSNKFFVETIDNTSGKKYQQEWSNGMKNRSEPIITDSKGKQHTLFQFNLNFDELKMDSLSIIQLKSIIHARAVQIAAFSPSEVHWNGNKLNYNLKSITDIYLEEYTNDNIDIPIERISTKMINSNRTNCHGENLEWNVEFFIGKIGQFRDMSIINGIYVKNGGSHVKYIQDTILEYIRPKYISAMKALGNPVTKINRAQIFKNLGFVLIGQIAFMKFDGQRKDQLDMPPSKMKEYKISPKVIASIWKYMSLLLDEKSTQKISTKKKKIIKKSKKYSPAQLSGGARSHECSLIIGEGDSACSTIDQILNNKEFTGNKKKYGWYSAQGVMQNVRKRLKKVKTTKVSVINELKEIDKKSTKIEPLVDILGLQYGMIYDSNNIKSLNYGSIIIGTDQDEDGKGKIRSLIVTFFQTLWPSLVSLNYIKFLVTPVIRAYYKKGKTKFEEFYSDKAKNIWEQSIGSNIKDYELIYYKGLGSHGPKEIAHMAKIWNDCIIQMHNNDMLAESSSEDFHGIDSSPRKRILSTPAEHVEEDLILDKHISVRNHFYSATKMFYLYDLQRHLLNHNDGMTRVMRQILFSCSKAFKSNNNKRMKIVELVGPMINYANYHHGDASATGSLIGAGQCFIGAKRYPILRALSNFGTRKNGGNDAGQPRYVFTKLNKPLVQALYPKDDMNILDYVMDEGKRLEPKSYAPVICTVILESHVSPSTGWKSEIHGRSFNMVHDHTKRCIEAGKLLPLTDTDFALEDFEYNHILTVEKNKYVSHGKYKYLTEVGKGRNTKLIDSKSITDIINITELPIGMWNSKLSFGSVLNASSIVKKRKKVKISNSDSGSGSDSESDTSIRTKTKIKLEPFKSLTDCPYVINYEDYSNEEDGVNIIVYMEPGSVKMIHKAYSTSNLTVDPIIKYFGMSRVLSNAINCVKNDGSVIEYSTYYDIFSHWFKYRKKLYRVRVERMVIILKLRILALYNKINYCKANFKMGGISLDDQITLLKKSKLLDLKVILCKDTKYTELDHISKYTEINHTLLDDPGFISTNELESKILNGDFMYLLDISDYKKNEKNIQTMINKLIKFIEELNDLLSHNKFPGDKIWLTELSNVKSVVDKARSKGWDSWDKY